MEPQHLIELKADNFKRLTAVAFKVEKDQRVVVITGENSAGKSSVLDSICACIQGKKAIPSKPIKTGHTHSEIIMKTEDLIITRRFTGENTYLDIKDGEGRKYSSPQELLDKMIAAVGFDPLSFANMKTEDQTKTLLKICPVELDLAKNAADYKAAYELRRDLNRSVKDLEAQISAMPSFDANLPTVEVSVAALVEEINRLQNLQSGELKKDDAVAKAKAELHLCEMGVHGSQADLEEAEKEVKRLKEVLLKKQGDLDGAKAALDLAEKAAAEKKDYSSDVQNARSQINNSENQNQLIRGKIQKTKLQEQLAALNIRVAKGEKFIEDNKQARSNALKAAKFPVDGLSLDDDGIVIYNGVPFSQASTSEQIRVGVALAAAASPNIRIAFIRDGSLLDKKSMLSLQELAEKHNLQVLVERVEDTSPTAIQIVDGSNIGAKDEPESDKGAPPSLPIGADASTTPAPEKPAPWEQPDSATPTPTGTVPGPNLLSDKETPMKPAKKGKKKDAGGDMFRA